MSLYKNYEMTNNLSSTLYAPISSTATSLQVETGQGDRWGNDFPIIATLEKFEGNKVVQREIILVTARTGDVLTITRKAFPCFSTDDENTQILKAWSFDSGDTISNYIAKEYIDKINDAIDDIYDNGDERIKAIPTGGLNIDITDGNVRVGSQEFYYAGGSTTLNDNATNYVMLDGAGVIWVDTTGRNQQYVKVATIITSGGAITDIHQWRMDAIGGVLGGVAGFKNISDTEYNSDGLLKYFIADGEEFNLSYKNRRLVKIVSGEKTYIINYQNGKFLSSQEN